MIKIDELSARIMQGYRLSFAEAKELLQVPTDELLFHANRLRVHFKGNKVNLCSIINAKSGACSENCRFCAQSAHHKTAVAHYPLVEPETIVEAVTKAAGAGAGCFGIVTSGKRLTKEDVDSICATLPKIKGVTVRIGTSFGELDEDSLRRLKESGVRRFHHNLETAESFFPNICTSHTFADRVATIRKAKHAGLEICCGGIFGLGETPEQRLELAFTLRELDVDSIPLNFLNPIAGTPMEGQSRLTGMEILRSIALFRFVLPDKDMSTCGGREVNLRDLQSWIFHAGINGMMVGGYLTTSGRQLEDDLQMLRDLGLEINRKEA